MCGRYSLAVDEEKIRKFFDLVRVNFEHSPRHNVAPGQLAPVIIEKKMGLMRWGLVPYWAQDEKIGYKLINARAETIAEKPSFRDSFLKRRCLIPADGFYEWLKEGQEKRPFRFVSNDLFAFAGIYDTWSSKDKVLHSFSIITCEANDTVRGIHHRMPVILDKGARDIWLDRSIADKELLLSFLRPYGGELRMYEVSPLVNRVANDDESVIEPVR